MTRPVRVQLSRKKGWRMPPHTVRATAATAAKTLALAQELLGHNNPAITGDVYRRGEVKVRPLR